MKNRIKKQSLLLIAYDFIVLFAVCAFVLLFYLYLFGHQMLQNEIFIHYLIAFLFTYLLRFAFKVYGQVWRYGDVGSYLRLITSDLCSMMAFYLFERIFKISRITLASTVFIFSMNLVICLSLRIMYRYCYEHADRKTKEGKIARVLLRIASLGLLKVEDDDTPIKKTPIAILGAGRIGTALAEEISSNKNSEYVVRAFLESNKDKVGRMVHSIYVYDEMADTDALDKQGIKEIVFAVPNMEVIKRQSLYRYYTEAGYKVKVYDFPVMRQAGEKRNLREFAIEELLFRKPNLVLDEKTRKYYRDKVVLITGGGGSIGSEMCRQIAAMEPKQIVLVDMYENGVYDVRTEMNFAYADKLDLKIEIANVCDKKSMDKIFSQYRPNIVIHAAAHKHVPLMEHNVVESIQNNVFGTLNVVEMSEKYKTNRFIMVSTDKAVNPTNVMGATKRVCEMIVMSHASTSKYTKFSATRFGNVLNSAGSVVPIFKKELENGGPLTVTDFRIIRYFMTIPEATQLVLKSSSMAKNGELFVLDMGKPVKILDLAENMIKLSGLEPYKDIDIVEIGLRPGEKLYEELLTKTEGLKKTSDKMIFIETDEPLSSRKITTILNKLKEAVASNDDSNARAVLKSVVPTFKEADDVNGVA